MIGRYNLQLTSESIGKTSSRLLKSARNRNRDPPPDRLKPFSIGAVGAHTPPEFRIPPRYTLSQHRRRVGIHTPSIATLSPIRCARYLPRFDFVVATTLPSIGCFIHSLTMKSLLLPTLFALTPLTLAQQALIPSTLPACAAQCTTLQNAQTSCQTNPTTQYSCFCTSSLLPSLRSNPPAQLQECTACSSADLSTIANWYRSFCPNGGSDAGATQPTTTSTAAKAPSATSQTTSASTTATAAANQPDSSSNPQGPW